MPTSRRKVPAPAKVRKPIEVPAVSAKKAKPAPTRKATKPRAVPVKKAAPRKAVKVPAAKKPVTAPRPPAVPVRPLMKLGRDDLAVLRWVGRPNVAPLPPSRVTALHAAPRAAAVPPAVVDGHASPLAPLRPDGRVATGLRGAVDPLAAYAPSVPRPCASCLTKPCICGAPSRGVHKDSPYGEETKVDNRVTSWRRWP